MRVRELNGELHTEGCDAGVAYLYMDCPHCCSGHLIQIKIALVPEPGSTHVWTWNGETDLERITLTPSIDVSGHWHGFVTDGEARSV